ncbi:MAG: EEP domain-containing protein [Gammaproteobacteria bacterium]|nr:EEP domain-containing protein [Gammaproteobacteria bacterium]MYE53296.1 EEP domain-containing protein [Gammaproteobacteria bacterium]MYF50449.1 EEP domain-containing protein [Gammaproteobacteria bacterium]
MPQRTTQALSRHRVAQQFETLAEGQGLRLLSFNIQVGIKTSRYRQYVTKGWKHVLPHFSRQQNLQRIADVVAGYDFVALQEVDGGSLRSGFVNQVEYLAAWGGFPHWYAQLNRDLGPLAQHGNGLLTRVRPLSLEDHKLPGLIPGRGAIVARLPCQGAEILVVLLHLSLGGVSRQAQLAYVRELISGEDHAVVMGDMNGHLARLLSRSPLKHSPLRSAAAPEPTWPAWSPALALDHVLVTPSIRVDDHAVLDCHLSDHRPVAVTLTPR